MATIPLENSKTYYYDPDGANAPLTMLFPDSTLLVDGAYFWLINFSTSNTPVTFLASGTDTIADPQEITVLAASHVVTMPELLVEYVLKGTQWRVRGHGDPDLAKNAVDIFTAAQYGGLSLATPVLGAALGATWETLTYFDALGFATPRGITQNLTNSSLTLTYPGVYLLSIHLNLEFTESQGSRNTGLRLYNLTDSVPGKEINVPVGRNQDGTLVGISLPLELTDVGKEVVLQIGGGSTILAVNYLALDFSLVSVGEFRGTLG